MVAFFITIPVELLIILFISPKALGIDLASWYLIELNICSKHSATTSGSFEHLLAFSNAFTVIE